MNERLEINGDLADEYRDFQEAEEANKECPRSGEDWIRCPDCQGEHFNPSRIWP